MIVLDTHAWLWWMGDPDRLGRHARREIQRARGIGICAISCLEVATLAARGRIQLDRSPIDWMEAALELPRVELLPIGPAMAAKAADLPADFPGDPADRLITATALLMSAKLVTRDERIASSSIVRTVW